MSNDVNRTLNDGVESSVNPQIQKYKETLKPKLKITKKDTDKKEGKVFNKGEFNKEYFQKNEDKINENQRNYDITNTGKRSQYNSIYYEKNKEKFEHRNKIYYQNNKEKLKENQRKYYQKKKNAQSDKNEGTSFVKSQTDELTSLVNLSIVCEEHGNLLNQREEDGKNGEENQIDVEDPNKIHGDDMIAKQVEKDYTSNDVNKILNDGAESSVNTQIHKYKETLKPNLKITKNDKDKGEGKVFNRIKYNKEYFQKNKKRLTENQRKYRQKKKNDQSVNNEGIFSVNPQTDNFPNKDKLPIVCEEEGNPNQGEEECNNGEDEQNKIEVEEPNKILEDESNTNYIDSNKRILPFDLNVEPEDENLED